MTSLSLFDFAFSVLELWTEQCVTVQILMDCMVPCCVYMFISLLFQTEKPKQTCWHANYNSNLPVQSFQQLPTIPFFDATHTQWNRRTNTALLFHRWVWGQQHPQSKTKNTRQTFRQNHPTPDSIRLETLKPLIVYCIITALMLTACTEWKKHETPMCRH